MAPGHPVEHVSNCQYCTLRTPRRRDTMDESNRELKRKYDAVYRMRNLQKRRSQSKEWRKANRERVAVYNRNYRPVNTIFRVIDKYKRSARKRRYDWKISDSEVEDLLCGDCVYCGTSPKVWSGIDRVDNDVGYVRANTVSACGKCNFMKHTLSFGDFVRQCAMIVDHFDPNK
jgi:uncharacterized protein YacL (UPF0231 family)